MRTLADLLATGEGRDFLREHGVTTERDAFLDMLRPPSRQTLGLAGRRAGAGGTGAGTRLVYVGHQVLADYPRSVKAKFEALRALAHLSDVQPLLLWADTDRAGSDRRAMTLSSPGGRPPTVRLAPRRLGNRETRFVPVSTDRLRELVAALRSWAAASANGPPPVRVAGRLDRLEAELVSDDVATLAQANLGLTRRLVEDHLDLRCPWLVASMSADLLREPLATVLESIDDVVKVFNETVERLRDADVDPRVHPLPDDYLPLYYSCDRCWRRMRLHRSRRDDGAVATATCRCGQGHRFALGDGASPPPTDALGELARTGRWSTDVTLPIYVNGLVSGVVGGRSSSLYGLVLNEVLAKVLGEAPVPILVPAGSEEDSGAGSLLHEFLGAP